MADPGSRPEGTWEDVYRHNPVDRLPWFTKKLDEDFQRALKRFGVRPDAGPVLDLGTGPGTAAIELARLGFDVTALDVSESAIRMARQRAGALGDKIEWVISDLFTKSWDERFQLVYDRGVYHSLELRLRSQYPDVVAPWLRPAGLLAVKTFSPEEPGDWGPHRIEQEELEQNLGGRLDLIHLEKSRFQGTLDHEPRAWFAVYQAPKRTTG